MTVDGLRIAEGALLSVVEIILVSKGDFVTLNQSPIRKKRERGMARAK